MSRGTDRRALGGGRGNARCGLPLALTLLAIPAASAEEIAVRVRDDGRVVTLEIAAASQAEAVLDVLQSFGTDYAVGTDSAGTRVLALVVADTPASGHPDPEAVASEPPPAPDGVPPERVPPDAMPSDATPPDASELGHSESDGHTSTEGFPLLPGTFVPGVRATGQTTDWGVPAFVLPDPPGPKASAPDGAIAPSEPAASVAGTGSPARPSP